MILSEILCDVPSRLYESYVMLITNYVLPLLFA